jgi:hypothetical protein
MDIAWRLQQCIKGEFFFIIKIKCRAVGETCCFGLGQKLSSTLLWEPSNNFSFLFFSLHLCYSSLCVWGKQYYTAAATVSRTQFGEAHPVSLHVKQQLAQALHGVGEVNKAIEVVQYVIRNIKMQQQTEQQEKQEGVVVVQASTIGGVTSLLYGWNDCKPDGDLCRELYKRLIQSRSNPKNSRR